MDGSIRRKLIALSAVILAACGSDTATTDVENGPYTLTFAGDGTFAAAHAGQALRLALVSDRGERLDVRVNTVGSGDPAFSFTFPDALDSGASYAVDYWIDSNFEGGAAGYCDEPGIDHQWSEPIGPVEGDVDLTVAHDPSSTQRVCGTFAFDLTFSGDATFQNTHGLQPVHVALVRAGDGAVLTIASGTVSSSDDPAFAFSFPAALLPDAIYRVHLWIDSNLGGGTPGVCDEPAVDHQWSVSVGAVEENTAITYSHDPTATTDVCASFGAG